eukprot:3140595-Amphidinium_carterae.1
MMLHAKQADVRCLPFSTITPGAHTRAERQWAWVLDLVDDDVLLLHDVVLLLVLLLLLLQLSL